MLITAFSTGSEYKKYTVSNILGYYVNFGRDIDVKNLLTCNLKISLRNHHTEIFIT